MRTRRFVALAVLAGFGLMVAGGVAFAQGKGKDKEKDKPAAAPRAEINDRDRDAIGKYFKSNAAGLPPGLAKRGDDLPAGLEKQLQKNGKLPPGLQKKVQPFPADLERRLCVLPTGYRRVVIAGNVIMMNEKTAVIYDIVRNVIQ